MPDQMSKPTVAPASVTVESKLATPLVIPSNTVTIVALAAPANTIVLAATSPFSELFIFLYSYIESIWLARFTKH